MQITAVKLTAKEVADIFSAKIKDMELAPDASGEFSQKFDIEYEFTKDNHIVLIYIVGRLEGLIADTTMGDEEPSSEIESRYINWHEFYSYIDGDDLKIDNESEIYELIEKEITI